MAEVIRSLYMLIVLINVLFIIHKVNPIYQLNMIIGGTTIIRERLGTVNPFIRCICEIVRVQR